MANGPTNQEVNIPEEEVNQSEIINTTQPTEDVTETPEVPVIGTPAVEAPVVETPVIEKQEEVNQTEIINTQDVVEKKQSNITEEQVRQALQLTASRGLDATESVAKVKESLEGRGFDSSQFETQFASTIEEFGQFDTSSDDFYSGIEGGQSYPSFVQKSANYQNALNLYNKVKAQDISENGIYLGLKNDSIDPSVLSKIKDDPIVTENIQKANKRIIREKLINGDIDSLYELPVGQQTQTLDSLMEAYGLNQSYASTLENDNTLSTNSEAYIEEIGDLNELYKKRDSLRRSIDSKYPNASESFKNTIFQRENAAILDQINEKEASAETFKTAYDFRFGELKTVIDLETAQNTNKFNLFRDVQRNNFALYLDEIKKADTETVSNFQFLSPGSGVIARTDTQSGEVKFFNTDNVGETFNEDTGQFESESITTAGNVTISGKGIDLTNSNYVSKYPVNASFKNNNPAGLTHGISDKLLSKLTAAGIEMEEGTNRPAEEGGSYIKFKTLNDGIDAMKIAFAETGWTSVNERLKAWKGAGTEEEKQAYADSILKATFGSEEDRSIDSLTYSESEKLLVQHLKREDTALYNVLNDEIGAIKEDGTLDYTKLKTKATSETSIEDRTADIAGLTVEIFGSRASDGERNAVETIVNSMPGASRDEIIGAVRGFKFNTIEGQEFGNTLLKTGRVALSLADIDLPGIASLIRGGNKTNAVNKIELSIDGTAKGLEGENYVSETNTRQVHNKVNELNGLIKQLEEIDGNPIGEFEGTLEGWFGRFKSGEAATIQAKATLLISKMRKDLIGANITAGESAALEGIIPELSDDATNYLIKTESLKTDSLTNLNAQRNRYGMPAIDEEALLNLQARVGIYEGTREIEAQGSDEEITTTKNQLNDASENPVYNFGAGSIIGSTTTPLSASSFLLDNLTGTSGINIDSPIDVVREFVPPLKLTDQSSHPIESLKMPSSLELLNKLLPSALDKATGWSHIGLDGKTVGQVINEGNSAYTAAAYDYLGVDPEATSTKVGEFLSADILFGAGIYTKGTKIITNKTAGQVINKLDKKIENDFISAIKPTNMGKSAGEQERYRAKSRQAIMTLTMNKDNLKLVNEFGETVKNKLPNTVHQMNDGVSQIKGQLYRQYNEIAEEAGASAQVNLSPIIKELEQLKLDRRIKDLPNSKQLNAYVDELIAGFSEEGAKRNVLDVQAVKQSYNKRLDSFYKNPDLNSFNNSTVDALVNNLLGKQLDATIESAAGKQYSTLKQQYGALSTIEKDVAKASAREFKKAGQSFVDYSDIFSAGDISGALVSGNASYLAKGGTQFFLKEWYKKINSADTKIANVFKNSETALNSK